MPNHQYTLTVISDEKNWPRIKEALERLPESKLEKININFQEGLPAGNTHLIPLFEHATDPHRIYFYLTSPKGQELIQTHKYTLVGFSNETLESWKKYVAKLVRKVSPTL